MDLVDVAEHLNHAEMIMCGYSGPPATGPKIK
jgi:hypothetical protein